MQNANTFIFDFDSTFIQVETLDILASVSLANHPDKQSRTQEIHAITELAMTGKCSYQESLAQRFALLDLNKQHIEQTIKILKQKISPSILRNIDFFKKNAENIYLITGAFIEIVWPIVQSFGLLRHQVFANRLLYDFEQNILGYDLHNPLAQDQGKVKLAHQLKLKDNIIVVGDGYNDYEIKEAGLANTFIAFTENIKREEVIQQSDAVINELEGLFITCNIPYIPIASHKKILLLENIHPYVTHYFKNLGYEVENYHGALDSATLAQKLKGIHILGIRSKTEIPASVIEEASTLEAIGAFCIGTNQIDLTRCLTKGIAVFNAPFSNTRSVVELAIGEMILLVRRAAQASGKMAKGIWHKTSQDAHEIRGKILGIIGYGNIGSQLSILAEAIGMQVIYYDIEDKLPLGNAKVCHHLEDLLSKADIVSVHVDGRKENRHLIGEKEFAMMKTGTIFLNLSRDFTVDYDALIAELASGKISGAGIDVFPHEPHESKSEFHTPLQQFENVLMTPHIGGSTEEAQQNIGEYVSKNLLSFISNGSSIGSVNFPQLYLPTMNYPLRIVHIHENVPGILAKINNLFARYERNIEGQFLKTNDNIGYVITDLNKEIEDKIYQELQAIPHTIKVKSLKKSL